MDRHLDHVVLWVSDPLASAEFYRAVVGLEPIRAAEYAAGRASFVSVRVGPGSILDLMPFSAAPGVDALAVRPGSAANRVNHVCLAVPESEFDALRSRLEEAGRRVVPGPSDSFGARGEAPRTFYFEDPDGNVLEARHYRAPTA